MSTYRELKSGKIKVVKKKENDLSFNEDKTLDDSFIDLYNENEKIIKEQKLEEEKTKKLDNYLEKSPKFKLSKAENKIKKRKNPENGLNGKEKEKPKILINDKSSQKEIKKSNTNKNTKTENKEKKINDDFNIEKEIEKIKEESNSKDKKNKTFECNKKTNIIQNDDDNNNKNNNEEFNGDKKLMDKILKEGTEKKTIEKDLEFEKLSNNLKNDNSLLNIKNEKVQMDLIDMPVLDFNKKEVNKKMIKNYVKNLNIEKLNQLIFPNYNHATFNYNFGELKYNIWRNLLLKCEFCQKETFFHFSTINEHIFKFHFKIMIEKNLVSEAEQKSIIENMFIYRFKKYIKIKNDLLTLNLYYRNLKAKSYGKISVRAQNYMKDFNNYKSLTLEKSRELMEIRLNGMVVDRNTTKNVFKNKKSK